jgi:hypothetical protein
VTAQHESCVDLIVPSRLAAIWTSPAEEDEFEASLLAPLFGGRSLPLGECRFNAPQHGLFLELRIKRLFENSGER